jgi:hypothetical protein
MDRARVYRFRSSETAVDRARVIVIPPRVWRFVRARPRKAEFSTSEVASDRKQSACTMTNVRHTRSHPHGHVCVWSTRTPAQKYHYRGTCARFFNFFFSSKSSVSVIKLLDRWPRRSSYGWHRDPDPYRRWSILWQRDRRVVRFRRRRSGRNRNEFGRKVTITWARLKTRVVFPRGRNVFARWRSFVSRNNAY